MSLLHIRYKKYLLYYVLFLPLSPDNMGLLDPATSDGRVIFFLPWEKMTIAGTTDTPTKVTAHPIPGEDDINFILSEVRNYLSPDVEGTAAGGHVQSRL